MVLVKLKERDSMLNCKITRKCFICGQNFTISPRKAAAMSKSGLKLPSTCYGCHMRKKAFAAIYAQVFSR